MVCAFILLLFIPLLQIELLELEKSSSQRNLDTVVGLATEQNICAREKYEEVNYGSGYLCRTLPIDFSL